VLNFRHGLESLGIHGPTIEVIDMRLKQWLQPLAFQSDVPKMALFIRIWPVDSDQAEENIQSEFSPMLI
jgi:hypothetical protein